MRRSPLLRRTPLARTSALGRGAPFPKAMPLASLTRGEPLKRSWMRRRPTRPKAGYEPKYRVFVRALPCAVCGRGTRSQFCHERVKGTGLGLKGPDSRGWPGCAEHHTDYDQRRGYFVGWSNEARVAWVDAATEPLRADYLRLYGSEPELREPIAGAA